MHKLFRRFTRFYSRLSIRSKLMLHFTLFGLAIGYFSFLFTVVMATLEFKNITTLLVRDWTYNNSAPIDVIDSFVGKKYNIEMATRLPFIALAGRSESGAINSRELNFYILNRRTGAWYRLYVDENEIMRKAGIYDPDTIADLNEALKKPLKMKNVIYWGRADSHHLWVNLTRPEDRFSYLGEFVINREGIINSFGGIHVIIFFSMGVLLVSYLVSLFLSYYISRPIKKLSSQTMAISRGDFTRKVDLVSRDEIGNLSSAINTMTDEIRRMIDDINASMNAISLMNKIDKAVLSSISRTELIDNVTSIVAELFSGCSVALSVIDSDKQRYHLLSRFIRGKKTMPDKDFYISFNLLGEEILRRNRSLYIISSDKDRELLNWLNRLFNENHKHIMNLPIYVDDEYAGSLIIGKDTESSFNDFEKDTSIALADQTGVAMKSVRYVEQRENLFLGILLALSRTIDAKSKWTSGHSERVAIYSRKIAEALNVTPVFINDLSISASLHDIGKIGVPEVILDKEGTLTDEEFEIIKKHPGSGAEIIEVIPGYEKFINGIIYHHEFWDGSGYPFGLEKKSIPLMGRIIAVADVYDSLISDRPYRKGMSREKAKEILHMEKEKKLDPEIVDIMIGIIDSEND